MKKLFISLLFLLNLYAQDSNTTQQRVSLDDDPLFHVQTEGIRLYDAINISFANSPKLDATKQYVLQQHEKLNEAQAGHLPVVNLSGDFGYEDRQFKTDPKNAAQAPVTNVYKYNKKDLYLTITENLWAGGSIQNSVNEKEAALSMAKYEYRDKVEQLVLDVATAYYNVVYGEIALNIAQKNMKNYEKILNIVSIKEQNGAATKGDVNFIKANVENAKTDMVQKQKALQDAISKYQYLLNSTAKEDMPFETESVLYKASLQKALDDAQQNNAKLLKQVAYIRSTKYSFLATQGSFAPKIDLSINGETRNEYDVGLGQREKINALITFNYNLYNGGKDEATAARLLAKMREQKLLKEDIQRNLTFDVKVLHQSISSLSSSLRLTENEVLASRKVVESYWISFQHGTQDLQALQLAQRNLNRAEEDYANYKRDLILNNFQLMYKTGVLLDFIGIQNEITPQEMQRDFNLFYSYGELK